MKIREFTSDFFDIDSGEFDRLDKQTEEERLQKRIDLRCLKNAVSRFLSSGHKDDAFDVYFCFSEIYKPFGEGYQNTQKLFDVLGDHETKAGSIKDTHRDHYSHMAYVFAMGLAIYEANEPTRKAFSKQREKSKRTDSEEFLYHWGLISLFHDIGYPFEIAFNNIKAYTQSVFGENAPLLTYRNIEKIITGKDDKDGIYFIRLSDKAKKLLSGIKEFREYSENAHTILAFAISEILDDESLPYEVVLKRLSERLTDSDSKNYLDHAYFSAIIVLKKFLDAADDDMDESEISAAVYDCACILLHNSFFKHGLVKDSAGNKVRAPKKIGIKTSVLLFLIFLCDDLQIFDRVGYGKTAKDEPLPIRCYVDKKDNGLQITYAYTEKANDYTNADFKVKGTYIKDSIKKLRERDLSILDFEAFGDFTIQPYTRRDYVQPAYHTSVSFYQNILGLAREIHGNYLQDFSATGLDREWDKLHLEEKMWNVSAAKSYAQKLNKLGYFYDDRELMLEKIEVLTSEQIEELARDEHSRWYHERIDMGWTYENYDATDKKLKDKKRSVFERKHDCLIADYDSLDDGAKSKDVDAVNNMLKNLKEKGFSVYGGAKKPMQDVFCLGITGHKDLSWADENELKTKLKEVITRLCKTNKHKDKVVICGCDKGFDTLACEVAMEMGLKIRVVVPFGADNPLNRKSDAMLELKEYGDKEVLCLPRYEDLPKELDKEQEFIDLAQYIAGNSNSVIAGWDGKETPNGKHGTYYTKSLAEKYGRAIYIIPVPRPQN